MDKKFVWVAVTADKYELPFCVEDTASKLANKLGIATSTLINSYRKNNYNGKNTRRRIYKVEIN